ncbi:MAG TPA: hypothetical protein VL688_08305 [Verrucomicrobiae bacterium]|nr:hypothetical protein [Verrucomicrobiae bacterium]
MRRFWLGFLWMALLTPAAFGEMPAGGHRPQGGMRPGPWGEPGSTLELAKSRDAEDYQFAVSSGAEIRPTEDDRSFTVWWQPENFDPQKDRVLVSLGGHQGWATRDFQIWMSKIKDRRCAILTVQWWYGRSAEWEGYAKPNDIYRWIDQELKRRGAVPGRVIFQGYSMGSANSYAVTYFDRQSPQPYFAVTISNSGPMEADFPPNKLFLESAVEKPFAGTHWILYCSELDKEQQNCCDRMDATQKKLAELGGKIESFMRDPGHSHGGFMHSKYVNEALDLAESLK